MNKQEHGVSHGSTTTTNHPPDSLNCYVDLPTEAMPTTIQLLNPPPITYDEAVNMDRNLIQERQYVVATEALYRKLWTDRNTMSALIKHHLGCDD